MSNIKILIVEDEPHDLSLLKELLLERTDIEIVGEVTKVSDLIPTTAKLNPDIIMLDVTLYGESVFPVLPDFERAFPAVGVIFTTQSEINAKMGMEFSSYPFLEKPYEPSELNAAIDKYYTKHKQSIETPNLEDRTYRIKNREGVFAFTPKDLIYVRTENGKRAIEAFSIYGKFSLGKSIGEFQKEYELPEYFFRMRSFLINLSMIHAIKRNENYEAQFKGDGKLTLTLTYGEYIELSNAFIEWTNSSVT